MLANSTEQKINTLTNSYATLLWQGKRNAYESNDLGQLINSISTEHDSIFLASLYKYFSESLRVIGRPEALSPQFHEVVIEATNPQLHSLADKRKARAARASNPAFAAEADASEVTFRKVRYWDVFYLSMFDSLLTVMPSLQSVLRNLDRRLGIWKSDVCWLTSTLTGTNLWQSLVILIVIIVQAIFNA